MFLMKVSLMTSKVAHLFVYVLGIPLWQVCSYDFTFVLEIFLFQPCSVCFVTCQVYSWVVPGSPVRSTGWFVCQKHIALTILGMAWYLLMPNHLCQGEFWWFLTPSTSTEIFKDFVKLYEPLSLYFISHQSSWHYSSPFCEYFPSPLSISFCDFFSASLYGKLSRF